MTKAEKDLKEEIEIFRQIRKWSRGIDCSLDLGFCEMLGELEEGLVGFFEEIYVDFVGVDLTINWTCPICETENTHKTSYYDDSWSDQCKECMCQCNLLQPDF